MSFGATPATVRAAITSRIAGLSVPSSLQQADTDALREADEPFMPGWEPSPRAHLAFFVDDRALDSIDGSPHYDGEIEVDAPIVIRVLHAARPFATDARTDWDNSGALGIWLLGRLLDSSWTSDAESEFTLRLPRGPVMSRVPEVERDGGWILLELRIVVRYTLSLAPAP